MLDSQSIVAGSVSAAVSADSVEEEVFENERFARGGALSGQVCFGLAWHGPDSLGHL